MKVVMGCLVGFGCLVALAPAAEMFVYRDGGEGRITPQAERGRPPSAEQDAPAAPATVLDSSYPRMGGRVMAVQGGAGAAQRLQAALDSAEPGDEIVLAPGSEFVGNFTISKKADVTKNTANKWLIIRSSAEDRLGRGERVLPKDAAAMPKIVSPNADAALKTAPGVNHVRLVGLEIAMAPASRINYGLVLLGDGGGSQNSVQQVPHDLVVDRCYIHGNATGNLRRGVALNSVRTAVVDSYIADCHEAGADAQAICGWNGPGPFKIENNYLEGSGENIMFGGADPSIKDLTPSDIEIRHNTLRKPLSWKANDPGYAGTHWSVKNLLELKNARRVVVEGNLLENCWVDAQTGFAFQLTPRNQDGAAPWSTVEDVAIANNVVAHAAGAVNILGRDNNQQSGQARRIAIRNNLFQDIGSPAWGKNGRFLQISETDSVTIDHNTVLHHGNAITAYGKPNLRFTFTNNLMSHNEYGVIGDSAGVGLPTLRQYFPNCVFKKNVIAGGRSANYPPDNFFPGSLAEAQLGDARLAAGSPYLNAGTDGKAIGADPDSLKESSASR